MENIYYYNTVIDAIEELNAKGFTKDFNLYKEDIRNNPGNYKIIIIYRYEGDSNPDDEATVYGMESISGKKGVFVSGFSANAINEEDEILVHVNIQGRE
jgi:hypothetical protein